MSNQLWSIYTKKESNSSPLLAVQLVLTAVEQVSVQVLCQASHK